MNWIICTKYTLSVRHVYVELIDFIIIIVNVSFIVIGVCMFIFKMRFQVDVVVNLWS